MFGEPWSFFGARGQATRIGRISAKVSETFISEAIRRYRELHRRVGPPEAVLKNATEPLLMMVVAFAAVLLPKKSSRPPVKLLIVAAPAELELLKKTTPPFVIVAASAELVPQKFKLLATAVVIIALPAVLLFVKFKRDPEAKEKLGAFEEKRKCVWSRGSRATDKSETEILTSASSSVGTESLKSASNSAVRSPDLPRFNSRNLKSFHTIGLSVSR
jgi:hypothetical protein